MTNNKKLSAIIFSSLLLTSSLTSPTLALDATTYLKQLEAQAKAKNGSFTYDLVDKSEDGNATIKGFSYSVEDYTVNAQEISFSKAEKIGVSGFTFENMTGNNIEFKGKGKKGGDINIAIENIKADNFSIPDKADRTTAIWPVDIGKAFIGGISITSTNSQGKVVANMPEVQLTELVHKGKKNFNLGSFKTSEVAMITDKDDNNFQMTFGGIHLEELEYFGLFGLQLGSFKLGALKLDGTSKKNEKINVDFAGLDIKNLYAPDAQDESRPLIPEEDLVMEVGQLQFNINGNNVMGWEKGYGTNITDPEKEFLEASGSFDGIYVDLTKLPVKPAQKQNLQALFDLGYEKITMNLSGKGTWDTKSGIIDMSQYKFDFEDMGSFDMALTISGYTPELARQISKISNQANFETDPQKKQALSLQLLAQMAALSFNKLQFKIEDDSLINKVINYQAKQLNQEPQQVTGIVGPMASIVLAPYNIPQFAASLGEALSIFLEGNKSITILANPDTPLAMTEIIALSSGARAGTVQPADLIERLNLTVSAE